MDARTKGITQVLQQNPLARPMLAIMARKGLLSGMGYEVEHVQSGGGFSATEYSRKELPNGRSVGLTAYYPGPLDGLAGLSTEITETYYVYVGWEEYNEQYERLYDTPPIDLPSGATGWDDAAFDGPRNWFAEFADAELAESFASSLPPYNDGDIIPPLLRN